MTAITLRHIPLRRVVVPASISIAAIFRPDTGFHFSTGSSPVSRLQK
jgi:hypothetical protein